MPLTAEAAHVNHQAVWNRGLAGDDAQAESRRDREHGCQNGGT